MKSIGIVRKVDILGRVVIPVETRKIFNIEVNDPVEIYVEGDQIILKKYEPACVFCGEERNVKDFKGKSVCENCLTDIEKRQLRI